MAGSGPRRVPLGDGLEQRVPVWVDGLSPSATSCVGAPSVGVFTDSEVHT